MVSVQRLCEQVALGCAALPPAGAVCRAPSCAALACVAHFDAGGGRVPCLAFVHPRARHLLRVVPLCAPAPAPRVFVFAQPVALLEPDAAPRPLLLVVAGAGDLYTGAVLERLAAAAATPAGAAAVVPVPPGARVQGVGPHETVVGAAAYPHWLLCARHLRGPHGPGARCDGARTHTAYAVAGDGAAATVFVGDSDGTVVRYAAGGSSSSSGSSSVLAGPARVVLRLATQEPVALLRLVAGPAGARYVVAVGARGRVALASAAGEALADFAAPAGAAAAVLAVTDAGAVLCPTPAGVAAVSVFAPPPRAPVLCVRGACHRVVCTAGLAAALRPDGTVAVFTPPALTAAGPVLPADAGAGAALGTVAARLAAAAARHAHLEALAAWQTAVLRVHALAARLRAAVAAGTTDTAPHVAYEAARTPDGRALLTVVLRNPTAALVFGAHRWALRTVVTQVGCGSGSSAAAAAHTAPVALGAHSELRVAVPLVLRACAPFAAASTLVCDTDTPADRAARTHALAAAHALYGAAGVPPPALDALCAAARAPAPALEVALPVPAAQRVFTAADYLVDAVGVPPPSSSSSGDDDTNNNGNDSDTFVMSVRGIDPGPLLGGAPGARAAVRRHVAFLPVCAAPPVFEFALYRPAHDVVLRVTLLRGDGGEDDDNEQRRRRLLDGMHASLLYRVLVARSTAADGDGDADAARLLQTMLDALCGTRVQEARALAAAALHGDAVLGLAARLRERVGAAAAGMRELLQVCDTSVPESIVL